MSWLSRSWNRKNKKGTKDKKKCREQQQGHGQPLDQEDVKRESWHHRQLIFFLPFVPFMLFLFRLLESPLRSGVLTATWKGRVRNRVTTEQRPRFPEQ